MSETVIIALDPEGARLDDVIFRPDQRKFVLGVPDSVLEDCQKLGINPDFFTSHETSFYGYDNVTDLEKVTGIENLAELINASTLKTAAKFIDAIQKSAENNKPAPFNGAGYGVSTVTTGRSHDSEEHTLMTIGIHETSYLTSAIMGDVYKTLRNTGHPAVADENLPNMPQANGFNYGVMFNSFGLNTSVRIRGGDDEPGNPYVFGTRPDGSLHVAMNEGLRPAPDLKGLELFTLAGLYKRGMKEELGITIKDDSHNHEPVVRELFLVKASGQFGIHVLADLNMDYEEFLARHARAKDRFENQAFVKAPFNREGLAFATQPDTKIVPYTRDLIQGLILDYGM